MQLNEGGLAQLTAEELSVAVDQCKELVLESAECSEERRWLVRRLIELRYQLQEALEKESEEFEEIKEIAETRVVLGHHLKLYYQPTSGSNRLCDRCSYNIWSVVQPWYQCSDCQYRTHVRCLLQTSRVCPHLKVSEDRKFEEAICPEIGLDNQGYACAECRTHICHVFRRRVQCFTSPISFSSALKGCVTTPRVSEAQEPRLCDYTGLYYCQSCHWNNKTIIPARVLHNWDFEPRPVSRASYQLLRLARNRPIIKINSSLIGFVEELSQMKKIREDLMLMKQYLVQCKDALQQDLPWSLVKTKHYLLKDNEHYSIQDLIEIKNTTLIIKMKAIRDKIEKHIKKDCKICSAQGYLCELCGDKNVVYPFDSFAYSCPECKWVYHKSCWVVKQSCPRCVRLKKRRSKVTENEIKNDDLDIDRTVN
ncbi:differentially expressed in FDCP 8 homolog isoform X2 [Lycorma delicatula]|uniref:differentially expressed in FDCP 8 homolog isoform X2 n=1 Tax=Lycorma delicatula TaxID=130591 RepID=UPI003F50FB01